MIIIDHYDDQHTFEWWDWFVWWWDQSPSELGLIGLLLSVSTVEKILAAPVPEQLLDLHDDGGGGGDDAGGDDDDEGG